MRAKLTALNGARWVINAITWSLVLGLLALVGLQFHSPEAPLFAWLADGLHRWGDPGLEILGTAIGAEWPEQMGTRGKPVSNWWLPLIPAGVLSLLRPMIVQPLTRKIASQRRRIATDAWENRAPNATAGTVVQTAGPPSTAAPPVSPREPVAEDPDKTFVFPDGGPQQIGRYEIVSELGRGSMGVVYKAVDPALSRTVAIKKILTHQMTANELEMYTERQRTEAQAGGRMNHPGIVAVYDLVQDRDGMAIVMEFVEGRTLQSLLDGERPTIAECLDLGIQIADALGCAHAQNIIHRDIKPANILLTDEGKAKITDFGIAKLEGTQLTRTGQALGTPAFMSPEQFTGSAIRPPSDVFSLGTILYLLLTGEKPFPGDSITTIAFKVTQTQPVQPQTLNPEIPEDLGYVVWKSLSKNAADRYRTAAEMARDLECIRDGQKLPSRADASRPDDDSTSAPR